MGEVNAKFRAALASGACGILGLTMSCGAWAQSTNNQDTDTASQSGSQVKNLEGVTVVGTRRFGRSSEVLSPVPVDILPMSEAATQGASFDLAQTLKYKVPSLVTGRSSGDDNNDSVDSIALRGLDSDQTLVLVNGKRMHQSAMVRLFGPRGVGSVATDINTIPVLAISQVQVLRDGAAAQYGSDAIAGVINIALKRRKGCEAVAGYGQYSEGDGINYLASAYCGISVGDDGVIAITGEYQNRGRSDRTTAANPLRTIGDAAVKNYTFYVNADIPFGDNAHFYFNGGMQNRYASSAAWGRGGVGTGDIPSRNSAAMYPEGYTPFIDPAIQNRQGTIGVKWMADGWHIDLSQTYGYNRLMDTIRHTMNASLANLNVQHGGLGISPSIYDAGGLSFEQFTSNVDFSKYFYSWLHGVNIAYGAEFRREIYRIYPGEPGSYLDYDGPGGGVAGSQGFPGFQPKDATNESRNSWAIYVDVETDWTDRFMTDQAIRHEHYSDFGSTTIGKISAAFNVTDTFLLRGSVSTGFRAPALQQRYFSSTFSGFNNGQHGQLGLAQVVIAPNGGLLAQQAGIPPLTEEKSRSATLGFTWTPMANLSVTLDGYRIDIDDRIILSDRIPDTDPNIGALLRANSISDAQFFFNAADTRTEGVDLTVNYATDLGAGHLQSFLAFNHNTTTIRSINLPPSLTDRSTVVFGRDNRVTLTGGAPRNKGVLGFNYTIGKWNTDLKIIHFGSQLIGGTATIDQYYAPRTSADIAETYHFTRKLKFTVGARNIFDVHPSEQPQNLTSNGFMYEAVQFGFNGTALYARLAYTF